jgi:hypothetical protein
MNVRWLYTAIYTMMVALFLLCTFNTGLDDFIIAALLFVSLTLLILGLNVIEDRFNPNR